MSQPSPKTSVVAEPRRVSAFQTAGLAVVLGALWVGIGASCADFDPDVNRDANSLPGGAPNAGGPASMLSDDDGSSASSSNSAAANDAEFATDSAPSSTNEGAPDLDLTGSSAPAPGTDSSPGDMAFALDDDSIGDASANQDPPAAQPFSGEFILGADISGVPETVAQGAVFVDTDGQPKGILELLANHGFNYIRLRTFVEPLAPFGYGSGDGQGCQQKTEAFNDLQHVVAFAQEVKAAGMGYLLDLHYSDTWADPGKQVIPEAWRDVTTIDGLAVRVREYTLEVVQAMVDAGARPDMVQVGNEITPGMLIHVPTANTDCYGNNSNQNQVVNGRANNWDALGTLLRAGADAVREVDDSIEIMLHIENTDSLNGVTNWIREARSQNVDFDVLGLSAYESFQGPSNAWRGTLQSLAQNFPQLDFTIAEYNPQRRLLNDIMRELPNGQGVGTFFWEPTRSGSWGDSMFERQGNTYTARGVDFEQYDRMRSDYQLP